MLGFVFMLFGLLFLTSDESLDSTTYRISKFETYLKRQDVLKNIKENRKLLLEKYEGEAIISKLSAKEQYEKIKDLCRQVEQSVVSPKRLDRLSTYLKTQTNLVDNKEVRCLMRYLRVDEDFLLDGNEEKFVIEQIDKLLDGDYLNDDKLQKILIDLKQESQTIYEAYRELKKHCCYFVGEDYHNNELLKVHYQRNLKYGEGRTLSIFESGRGDARHTLLIDSNKLEAFSYYDGLLELIDISELINYLQKP